MPNSSPLFAPSFQIIVVPPDEDEEQNYIVFDAQDIPESALSTPPDFFSLDDALTRIHGTEPPPEFTRTSVDGVIMPRRSDARQQPELADETVREDSEIVEVIKVRRAFSQDQDPPPPPPKPKPKSLRFRASSAFRSIKNLARSSSRTNNKPYAQEVFASSQSTQATFATAPPSTSPATQSPPLSRRGSLILTQLFRTPSQPDPPSPSSTFDFPVAERYVDDDGGDDDDDRESFVVRAPSPSPSTRTFTSSIRRRLSILSFQRKPHTAPPRPSSPPTLSRGSTIPSASSSVPQTPTDETYPHSLPNSKDADDDPDRTILGEMRLDSLHFDSLSFDPDDF